MVNNELMHRCLKKAHIRSGGVGVGGGSKFPSVSERDPHGQAPVAPSVGRRFTSDSNGNTRMSGDGYGKLCIALDLSAGVCAFGCDCACGYDFNCAMLTATEEAGTAAIPLYSP